MRRVEASKDVKVRPTDDRYTRVLIEVIKASPKVIAASRGELLKPTRRRRFARWLANGEMIRQENR